MSLSSSVLNLHKSRTILWLFAICAFCLNSCTDREEPIPAYLHITKFDLQTNPDNSQGTNSNKIVDGWVFVNNEAIGVFELPITIPVLKEGEQIVKVFPGINKNGLFDQRVTYGLYTIQTDTLDLVPGEIDTIRPTIEYREGVQFSWLEEFEDRSISLEPSGNSVTVDSVQLTDDPLDVFGYDAKNRYSAFVDLDTGVQKFENSTISSFDLPRGNPNVYLELNYKSDVNLQVGLYAVEDDVNRAQIPILLLFPTDEWKKIYVSLAEDINDNQYAGMEFKVFFQSHTGAENVNQKFFIDNLKVVHF